MKYGSEDFEQLKKTVGDFFQNGPLGDIRVYWYMIYPYKDGRITIWINSLKQTLERT